MTSIGCLMVAVAAESWTTRLELGTIGEWISGLATAGALIGTLFVLRNENRALAQQAKEQQSAESARVAAQKATDEQLALTRESQTATDEQLTLAREQAQISRDALRSALRPFLVDIPTGSFAGRQDITFDDGTDVYVGDAATIYGPSVSNPPTRGHMSVSVRNIGKGAAVITGLGINHGGLGWSGKMSRSIVPPDEHTRLTFTVPTDRPELMPLLDAMDGAGSSFSIEIGYTDLSGADQLRTVLMFSLQAGAWKIRQVGLFESTSTTPFVMSGPADG